MCKYDCFSACIRGRVFLICVIKYVTVSQSFKVSSVELTYTVTKNVSKVNITHI